MIDPKNIETGKSYAAKFKTNTMLDTLGRPAPNLSDTPIKGFGDYEGFGLLVKRDTDKELFEIHDIKSKKDFVVPWADVWDIDEAEFQED